MGLIVAVIVAIIVGTLMGIIFEGMSFYGIAGCGLSFMLGMAAKDYMFPQVRGYGFS